MIHSITVFEKSFKKFRRLGILGLIGIRALLKFHYYSVNAKVLCHIVV